MSDVAVRIKQELEGLGYSPEIETHSEYSSVVVIDYEVKNGRFKSKTFRFGISCQGAEAYPEYPPHFIHLSPPIEQPQDGGIHSSYSVTNKNDNACQWVALSRPPGPFWDDLPTKSMRAYLEHIARFWSNV